MPVTPSRARRKPQRDTRFLSEVLADNVRLYRGMLGMSQNELAERMRSLHHDWHRATVSEVERGGRNVSVDELGSLALLLGRTISDLLDPLGPDRKWTGIDTGGAVVLDPGISSLWVRDRALLALEGERLSREVNEHQLHPYARGALRALQIPTGWQGDDLEEGEYDPHDSSMVMHRRKPSEPEIPSKPESAEPPPGQET